MSVRRYVASGPTQAFEKNKKKKKKDPIRARILYLLLRVYSCAENVITLSL